MYNFCQIRIFFYCQSIYYYQIGNTNTDSIERTINTGKVQAHKRCQHHNTRNTSKRVSNLRDWCHRHEKILGLVKEVALLFYLDQGFFCGTVQRTPPKLIFLEHSTSYLICGQNFFWLKAVEHTGDALLSLFYQYEYSRTGLNGLIQLTFFDSTAVEF